MRVVQSKKRKRKVRDKHGVVPDLRALRTASRPPVTNVSEVYANGKMRDEFNLTDVEDMLVARQRRAAKLVLTKMSDDDYRIPLGVRVALKQGFTWNQICHEFPWAVIWLSDGERKQRKCRTLWEAVNFHKKAIAVNSTATIVSRQRAYDIPPQLRNKLPHGWKWCPRCMKPRKYKRMYQSSGDAVTFYANVKVWNKTKEKWDFAERKLHMMECPICLTNNRDPVFRRSNQPFHKRKIKKGVTRVRRTRAKRTRKK